MVMVMMVIIIINNKPLLLLVSSIIIIITSVKYSFKNWHFNGNGKTDLYRSGANTGQRTKGGLILK
jgi:hypothetical protein